LAIIEVISALLGLAVALALAFRGAGAWAIVLQQIAIWISKVGMFAALTSFRPRFHWGRRHLDGHLVFARDNIGGSLLYFLTRQLDPLVILKVLGAAALGNYSFATRIMMLPQQLIGSPSQNTLYVRMTELRDRGEALKDLYLIVTNGMALTVLPAVAILGAASASYFTLIVGPEWASAARVFMCLAPIAALQTLMVPAGALLPAVGRTTLKLRLQFEVALLWAIGLLVSVRFGLVAVGCAFTLVNLAYFPRFLQLTLPVVGCTPSEYLRGLRTPAAAAALGLGLHLALKRLLAPDAVDEIVLSIVELTLIYAILAWIDRRRLLNEARTLRTIMRMPAVHDGALRPGA
jgi:PST family polysaccharide transporter